MPYTVAIEGIVCKPVENRGEGQLTVVAVDSIWVLSSVYGVNGRCLLRLFEPIENLSYGDRIVARCLLRSPPGERNPGEFDYRKYLASQNIHAVASVATSGQALILSRGEGALLLKYLVYPARRCIIDFIDSSLTGQQAALLKALLVGARGDIDNDLRNDFADVGVIHVLAVSGLHVGFILIGLIGLFGFLHIANPWRTILVILGLLFYAWITGLSPSVVRATIMAIVYVMGLLLQRRADVLNSLAVAAMIILFIQPLDLFQPGFQLSFAAVAGIVLLYRRLLIIFQPLFIVWREKGMALLYSILALFFVSLAAQLATLPLTVYYFGRLPLVSLTANLIVVPMIGLIVALGLVAVLAGAASFSFGAVFMNTVWLLLTLLIALVKGAAKIPFAYLELARPSAWGICFYLAALFLFLVWRQQRTRKFAIVMIILGANLFVWTHLKPRIDEMKITFFDVGQGDSALVQFPNGKTMLIDAGDCSDYVDYGERVIVPYLQRQGIRKIDYLLLTHAHSDHIGGAPTILQNMSVGCLVESACPYESEISDRIDSLVIAHHIYCRSVVAGDTLLIDPEVLILIMHPTPRFLQSVADNPADLNNASVVVKCIFFGRSVLFAGDAEIDSEEAMLRYESLLSSEVLKIGHHGSRTAGSLEFRRRVAPKFGVVSVAKFNRFGLPSDSLLHAFRQDGADVLKTSESGAVQFSVTACGVERLR